MKLIDSHAHLTDERFKNDFDDFMKRCSELSAVISASYDYLSSKESVELSKKFDFVYSAVGIHPENVDNFYDDFEKIKKLATEKKVVAIGEIGLDYHFLEELPEKERQSHKILQKEAFVKQLELAESLNLPVVIHSRDAIADTIEILKQHPLSRKSLLHCYSGSLQSAEILMKMGFSFSFGGVVTFKNAKNVVEVVKNLPLERILLETDCPYMAPEPFRGTRNEPKNVVYIADKISKIKEISIEEVATATTENAKKLFNI